MSQQRPFAYRLANAFFVDIHFTRGPDVPENPDVAFEIQVRTQTNNFPQQLQVELQVTSQPDQPFTASAHLIGLFEPAEDAQPLTEESVPNFLRQRALYVLFPFVIQFVRQTTSQMSMAPVIMPMPPAFDLKFAAADD